jgi:hypothetical protein
LHPFARKAGRGDAATSYNACFIGGSIQTAFFYAYKGGWAAVMHRCLIQKKHSFAFFIFGGGCTLPLWGLKNLCGHIYVFML